MPYSNNVPQAAQTIASSQNQILQNFITIQQWTNVDHVEITGAGGNEGKHAKVSLIQQPYVAGGNFTPAIDAVSGVGTVGIYAARNTSNNGPSRMWAVIPRQIAGANFTTFDVPFTESTLLTKTPPYGTGGYTYFPSGLILQWGTFTLSISNTTSFVTGTINYVTQGGITFPNGAINVLVTSLADDQLSGAVVVASAVTTAPAANQFDVVARAVYMGSPGTPNSRSFRYLAIGF